MYSCSCADWATHSTVCKHIHFIAIQICNKEGCNKTIPSSSKNLASCSQSQPSEIVDVAMCDVQAEKVATWWKFRNQEEKTVGQNCRASVINNKM